MRHPQLVVVLLAVVIAGCECRPQAASGISGEVRWEWDSALGVQGDSSARVDFPPTPMGSRREQTLYVVNVGRAAFSMTEFAQISGSPVTLGLFPVQGAAFEVKFQKDAVVNPTEKVPVTVVFAPPVTVERLVDYASEVELRPNGAAASRLTINGRAIAGECEVPAVIDFGAVPIGTNLESRISIANDGAAAVTVTAGGVTGAPVGIFEITGLGSNNSLYVQPGEAPTATVLFKPTEPRDYSGQVTFRRGESCPMRTIQLKGRGVQSCLSWVASPPDDPQGNGLHFGSVQPSSAGPGKVDFKNACSLDVTLTNLRTTDPVFVVTEAAPNDVTTLEIPAATRDMNGDWVDGTATAKLEFRPVALGPKLGTLQAATTLTAQAQLAITLKGFGGGPKIEVRPSPVFAIGRVGFTPNAVPGTFAQRTLRVANVGNRPNPPDPRANLRLGMNGQGTPYWSVRAITGSLDELCIGEWNATGNTCAGTLSATDYDPALGIEAIAGTALNLPVRVIPATAGAKEWELTIYSNDVSSPATTVRITADAVVAPPCNYSASPTNLNFGIMDVPQVKDLSFTLTNLGTGPTEICYFNGLGLSPQTADTFTLPTAMSDFQLGPGQSQVVTVRARPLATPPMPTTASGAVLFNVSTPGASQGAVILQATLAPACITVTPKPALFADTELECGSPDRAIQITNGCSQTVTLNAATLTNAALAPAGTGSCTTAGGCPQFVMTSAPTFGTLAPGASRVALLRFRPYLQATVNGELTFTVQQGAMAVPYPVPLTGVGKARTSATCGVTAVCPGPITTSANSTVSLQPTVMSSGGTTCSWTVGSRPSTSSGTFSAPTSCTSTNYFADVVGTHVVNFNVSDGLGGTAQCSVPITVNPNGDLWIELTWDRANDMDLHLLHPNAGSSSLATSWGNTTWDCHFRNRTPTWGGGATSDPSLDRDDITGTGPENTRINTPSRSFAYTVGVHMYSYSASPSTVTSTLKVYCAGQLMTTQTRTMSTAKNMWVVGRVDFSTGTAMNPCTFTPINTIITNVN